MLLKRRVYNVSAFSTCPRKVERFILEKYPNFSMDYDIDFRQQIASNWPATINSTRAERHWDMKIDYDFRRTMESMLDDIKEM